MSIKGHISITDLARTFGVTRQAVQKMLKGEDGLRVKKVGAGFLYEINSLPKVMQERIHTTQKEAADSVIPAGTQKHKDIDFEKELWNAADRPRGNIDAGEYKHVVLGLLFLKDVSDAFYMRRAEFETRLAAPKDKEQN